MKYFLILSLSTIGSVFAQSQVVEPILRKFSEYPSSIKVVEIIDARLDKRNIGILIDTTTARLDTLVFGKSLPETLMPYFEYCLTQKTKYQPIILKINSLEFSQRPAKKGELTMAFCDFEVYTKINEGQYQQLSKSIYCFEGKTKQHYDLVFSWMNYKLWADIFDSFPKSFSPISKTISREELMLGANTRPDSLPSGVYYTSTDFFQNKPQVENIEITQKNTGLAELRIENAKTKKYEIPKPKNLVWGFSDGKKAYLNFQASNQFVAIEPLGSTYEIANIALKPYHYYGSFYDSKRLNDDKMKKRILTANALNMTSGAINASRGLGSFNPTLSLFSLFAGMAIGNAMRETEITPRFFLYPSSSTLEQIPIKNIEYLINATIQR